MPPPASCAKWVALFPARFSFPVPIANTPTILSAHSSLKPRAEMIGSAKSANKNGKFLKFSILSDCFFVSFITAVKTCSGNSKRTIERRLKSASGRNKRSSAWKMRPVSSESQSLPQGVMRKCKSRWWTSKLEKSGNLKEEKLLPLESNKSLKLEQPEKHRGSSLSHWKMKVCRKSLFRQPFS